MHQESVYKVNDKYKKKHFGATPEKRCEINDLLIQRNNCFCVISKSYQKFEIEYPGHRLPVGMFPQDFITRRGAAQVMESTVTDEGHWV